ncbi:MAG: hypothetical protein ACI4HZ_03805 [Ruminococcus sp.]
MTYNDMINAGIELAENVYLQRFDYDSITGLDEELVKVVSSKENDTEVVTDSPLMDMEINCILASALIPGTLYLIGGE